MARLLGLALFIICVGGVAWYVAPPKAALGFSGLEFATMTRAAAARAPLLTTRGALIYNVVADSPAARVGIKPGEVVAAIDGVAISSARQASDLMADKRAGDSASLTLFDETKGDINSRQVSLVFVAAPPVTRKLSVKPPRTLAKEFFFPPAMAANAAWSRRLAHGASLRPLSLTRLDAGNCSALAPEDWSVVDYDTAGHMLHLASGASHVVYKVVHLDDGRDPHGFIFDLLFSLFGGSPVVTPVVARPFGFSVFNFGAGDGTAGFAVWRVTGHTLTLWVAGVPASDAAWDQPLAGAIAFSVHCQSDWEPAASPYESALAPVTVSTKCLAGRCGAGDLAATMLDKFRLGYVHGADGSVFLINPRRDFWQTGPDGPGFYRQVGGSDEKLEPGRVN
jgi:hypothetical protein